MKEEILIKKLNGILNNKTSGSVDLLGKLNDLVRSNADDLITINKITKSIGNRLQEFQIITKYLNQVKELNKNKNRDKLKTFLNNYSGEIANQNETIYQKAEKLIIGINKILTLSNSKTVFEVFKRYSQKNNMLKIFICESRPQNEGRVLTKLLLDENIKCELILDAMLPHFIQKTDAIIIGADKILKNGNVINKIGSLNAALLSKKYKKPFYVIASKDKISNQVSYNPIPKDSNEIWNYSNENLKINNFYFEEIDKRLITKIITN